MSKKFNSICKFCNKEFSYGYSSGGIYCNNKCQRAFERSLYLQKLKDGLLNGKQISRVSVYRYLVEERGNFCEICNITEWNTLPIRLWVDHKDGCAANNSWDNLRLICPNCDSQLPTCRGKNKGKGRKSLGFTVS